MNDATFETNTFIRLRSDSGQRRNLLMRVGIKLFSQMNRSRRNKQKRFFFQGKGILIQENVSFIQKF